MRVLIAARAGQAGPYADELRATYGWLTGRGHPDPLSYDVHAPMPVSKAGMGAALDAAPGHDAHKRTVYGVLGGLEGEQVDDVKITYRAPRFGPDSRYLSTLPDAFTNGHVGRFIRDAFPKPCRYERTGRC